MKSHTYLGLCAPAIPGKVCWISNSQDAVFSDAGKSADLAGCSAVVLGEFTACDPAGCKEHKPAVVDQQKVRPQPPNDCTHQQVELNPCSCKPSP